MKPVRLRRISQVLFFLLFLFLLLRTELRGSAHAAGDMALPYPVHLFFQIDPLVAVSNALATHSLYRGLLWSLVVLIPTLFLGRFFCGWICPMGSLNHFFGSLKSERKRGKQLIESNRYKRWQTAKYYVLVVVLVAAVFGTGIVGWFDPFSLLVRSLGLSILPGLNYALTAVLSALEHSHLQAIQTAGSILHFIFGALVLSFKQPYFRQGVFFGLIFIFLVTLNLRVSRFWCRALCPLGALLGAVSRWSIFGLAKNAERCNDCNRCLMRCQGGDDPTGGGAWRKAECHLCLNCVDQCPERALGFQFFPESRLIDGPDLQRRKLLAGAVAGAAVIPLARSTNGYTVEHHERLLRPPGALDEQHFLERCIRCGECMKVCPNNALHPTLTEAGLEGLWTPVLVPRAGYCETSCTLCSEVCPTGAIWKITPAEKGWSVAGDNKPIRLGTAFYDRGRCLPWAMATECIVCEEWCPTSPKAIYLREAEVADSKGNVKRLKQPYLDPSICVGCGACEYACPVQDRPAVYVTSVGESRSQTNQILLNRGKRRPS